jgi:hypothetical protein
MFRFIYCFIFQLAKIRTSIPEFHAACFVWFYQFTQIAFILSIVKKTLDISFPRFSEVAIYNKLFFAPIAIVWLILTLRYYNKRSEIILKTYAGRKILTVKHFLIVFTPILIQIFVMSLLLKK